MGRFSAWSVGVFLAFVGSTLVHGLTYAAVVPDAQRRAHVLDQTGHSYLAYLPFVLGLGGALALLGLVARVAATERRSVLPGWPVALLPTLTFAVQEHIERLGADGGFPWHALLDPTFVPGLLLQLPLGALAFVVSRALLRSADKLGALVRGPSERTSPRRAAAPRIRSVACARTGARASGRITRGPPARVAA